MGFVCGDWQPEGEINGASSCVLCRRQHHPQYASERGRARIGALKPPRGRGAAREERARGPRPALQRRVCQSYQHISNSVREQSNGRTNACNVALPSRRATSASMVSASAWNTTCFTIDVIWHNSRNITRDNFSMSLRSCPSQLKNIKFILMTKLLLRI